MSRFVSAGTNEEPVERDAEWLKAQEDIEAARRRKEETSAQSGGKSLYETLQANQAAKQEAFEESIRLKNQFRALDDDEVEFLDSVLESTRAKEDAVRKETSEQLEAFRRQREEAERAAKLEESAGGEEIQTEENWATGRKRRRAKDKEFPGVKVRRQSSSAWEKSASKDTAEVNKEKQGVEREAKHSEAAAKPSGGNPAGGNHEESKKASPTQPLAKPAGGGLLGLGDYSSDDD